MPKVVALYRYPVKSFGPESPESLTIQADGRIVGDRVLGFRFADTPEADDMWSSKHGMLALVNTPGLAKLNLQFDDAAQRLRLSLNGSVIADESLDPAGRSHLCDVVAAFASDLHDGALYRHPERLPLRLVGDGRMPRYHDRPKGFVTLHGRASVEALGAALNDPDISEIRFRSNLAIDGVGPWEEQDWVGRSLRIGEVRCRVEIPILRCLATHANPVTGERDQPVLTTLTRVIGLEEPALAVGLVPLEPGIIRLGDELVLEG